MNFSNYLSAWLIVLLVIASTGAAMNAKAQGSYVPQKTDQSQATKTMSQAELEARGKALRQAIDAKYKELEAPGGTFFNPPNVKVTVFRKVDVTDIVVQYISVGMSFSDLTVILKAGGFIVSPLGPGTPNNEILRDKNAGIGGGLKLVADMHWFTGVGITAMSNSQDGHSVATISAMFSKQLH